MTGTSMITFVWHPRGSFFRSVNGMPTFPKSIDGAGSEYVKDVQMYMESILIWFMHLIFITLFIWFVPHKRADAYWNGVAALHICTHLFAVSFHVSANMGPFYRKHHIYRWISTYTCVVCVQRCWAYRIWLKCSWRLTDDWKHTLSSHLRTSHSICRIVRVRIRLLAFSIAHSSTQPLLYIGLCLIE